MQDSTPSTVCLATPHGAQLGASTFALYTTWALGGWKCTCLFALFELAFHCGVNTMDPEAGGPPGWRTGRKTGKFFAYCGDIMDSEDNFITMVALQETSLKRGIIE